VGTGNFLGDGLGSVSGRGTKGDRIKIEALCVMKWFVAGRCDCCNSNDDY
jgi:hypothetical protein